ncbi:hypothetical protein PRIPAC_70601 [Pristionchus pacificus]|uniref:Skp1-related protein n=1 Tax=Pristionchus pacificus TaxID=54126 RepID=A0A454Y1M0_PRIPA|nr:hypothetical protein PRIPAC_70601 [Pristionchus pacificus]|eukprot:PDM81184.1 hypothetical protein PRIPAC_36187 [Pristionchus pacificus]
MPSLVTLVSSDSQEFKVEPKIAAMSKTVSTLMEALNMDETANAEVFDKNPIPLPNVEGFVLEKVVEWCEKHKDDEPIVEQTDDGKEKCTTDIPEWDIDFFKVDQKTLFGVLQAANYMDIKGLMINACKTVANMIKGKSAQQIRDHFHIVKDLTDEEEEKIRKENSWCDE